MEEENRYTVGNTFTGRHPQIFRLPDTVSGAGRLSPVWRGEERRSAGIPKRSEATDRFDRTLVAFQRVPFPGTIAGYSQVAQGEIVPQGIGWVETPQNFGNLEGHLPSGTAHCREPDVA